MARETDFHQPDPAPRPGCFARVLRMIRSHFVVTSCLLMVLLASTAPAANAEDLPDIKGLRAADFIDSAKRQVLAQWVSKQAEVLLNEDVELPEKRRIRDVFRNMVFGEPPASGQFKERFPEAVVKVFGPHLKDGEPGGAMTMAMILYDLRTVLPEAGLGEGGVLNGLSHPLPAVKYYAARTIRLLHRRYANLGVPRRAALAALREAGINETDGEALREIYLALDFGRTIGKVDFASDIVDILVDILVVRGERYALREVEVSAGDAEGLAAMARLSGPMTDKSQAALRKRYLIALGQMLVRVAEDYRSQLDVEGELDRDRRLRILRLLLLCRDIEGEFRRIVKAAGTAKGNLPNLYLAMERGVKPEILLERNKWVGWPPESRGELNNDLLGVPLGAGVVKLRARAETQPATTQAGATSDGSPANP